MGRLIKAEKACSTDRKSKSRHSGADSSGIHIRMPLASFETIASEPIPNQPILAGQTHNLAENDAGSEPLGAAVPSPAVPGLLAMGSPELSVWRRE